MHMIKIKKVNDSSESGEIDLELYPDQDFNRTSSGKQQISEHELFAENAYKCTFVDNPEQIISINGEELKANGRTKKNEVPCWRLEDAMGFAQFSVDYLGTHYVSKYISIWIKNTKDNIAEVNNLKRILDYVYDNIEEINPTESLNSRMKLVERIRDDYKRYYPYFVSQCHSTFNKKTAKGNIEKLKTVTTKTTKFMATHPQYMLPQNDKVQIGEPYDPDKYYPYKTLVYIGVNSFDTYENRVIAGFLKYLLINLSNIDTQVSSTLERYTFNRSKNNYIYGPSVLIDKHKKKIKSLRQHTLNRYRSQLSQILHDYETLFEIKAKPLREYPRITPAFRSLPQYKAIFDDINKWFNIGNYDLSLDMNMYFFHYAYDAYEKYCLINLIQGIPQCNFDPPQKDYLEYEVERYDRTDFNIGYSNHFFFSKPEDRSIYIDLYYQPVVHMENVYEPEYGVNLLKTKKGKQVLPYWPDFILKIHKAKNDYYLICDAKYSIEEIVRQERFDELRRKYQENIKLNDDNSNSFRIGVLAFYGKTNGSNEKAELLFSNINNSHISFQYDKRNGMISGTELKAKDKQEGLCLALSPEVPFERVLKIIIEKIIKDPMHLFTFDPMIQKKDQLFSLSSEEQQKISINPNSSLSIWQIARLVNNVIPNNRQRFAPYKINQWLLRNGILTEINDEGKKKYILTEYGKELGGQYTENKKGIVFSSGIQKDIIDHAEEIMST